MALSQYDNKGISCQAFTLHTLINKFGPEIFLQYLLSELIDTTFGPVIIINLIFTARV